MSAEAAKPAANHDALRVRPGARQLVASMLVAVLACELGWLLTPYVGQTGWLLLYPAVFIAAWLGGLAGGCLATAVCAVFGWFVLTAPPLSFTFESPYEAVPVALFAAMGLLVSLLLERLRRAERERENVRLEALASQSLVGLYIVQDGRFRYVNDAFAAIFGYEEPADLLGRVEVLDLVAPEDRARVEENLRRRLSGEAVDVRYTFTGLHRDGRRVELESHGRVAQDGDNRFILGVAIDITERRHAQQALAASEARYRLATQAAKEAIWERNLRDGSVLWNEAYLDMFGRAEEEGASSDWWVSHLHPDDRARVLKSFEDAIARGDDAWHCDYRMLTADGGYAYLTDRAVIVRDESGHPLRAIGAKLDVTEQVLAERALTTAQHDLERAQAMGRIGSWRLDLATNALSWSEELHRMFGVPRDRALTLDDFGALVHPDDYATLERAWNGALQGQAYDIEHRAMVDGSVIWCRECGELEFDEQGRVVSAFGTCQDITARKLAIERLQELAEAVGAMAAVRELPELLATVCRAARRIVGCDGATIALREGRECHYIEEDAMAPLWKGLRFPAGSCVSGQVMDLGEPVVIEDIVGHPMIPQEIYAPTFVRGLSLVPVGRRGAAGALGCYWTKPHEASPEELRLQRTLADAAAIGLANLELISRLEKARLEAERYAEAKSAFLANMSHEIRTPLHGVLAFAQIGQRDSERDPRNLQTFRRILESGRLLLGIIDDVLDFSKIEAGKLEIERLPISPRQVALESMELFRAQAEDKGLELRTEFAPDLPAGCLADPLRLRQILMNLLSNALKFTNRGEIVLSVARAGGELAYSVRDTGAGMTTQQLAQIFEPFRQADSSTTRRFGGSGLGLSICKRLAELMNGEIRVESYPGSGSCFELRFPLVEVEAGPVPAEPPAVLPSDGRRLAGYKILIAEDNAVNQLVLEDFLQGESAEYEIVSDGRQALERIASAGEREFDAVLMDIQMPVMDGYEATRRILEIAPRLPILGQTAHALPEESERCHAAGMVAHLAKPIELEQLVAAIRRHALSPSRRA